MNLCVISSSYPSEDGIGNTFVEQLVNAMTRLGHHCVVISPLNTFVNSGITNHYKKHEVKTVDGDRTVEVYRPRIWNRNIPIVPVSTNLYLAQRAIEKTIKKNKLVFDVLYCHFFTTGILAWHYAFNNNIPLFVATGESKIKQFSQKPCFSFSLKKFRQYTSGVICVSSKNLDESVELGYAEREKCKVFPNGANLQLFKPLDKKKCRQQIGLKDEGFLLITVGEFSDRKGQNRIIKAVDSLSDPTIKTCFIGSGEPIADRDYVFYKGRISHDELPVYLNAADVFVLPTLREGCCNAIVEALACGLPVVSSDRKFNYDILDETNSIMVDPEDVNQISTAIKFLREDNTKRELLAKGALKKAEMLSIDQRAFNIIGFFKERM